MTGACSCGSGPWTMDDALELGAIVHNRVRAHHHGQAHGYVTLGPAKVWWRGAPPPSVCCRLVRRSGLRWQGTRRR
jgi:hypothetical protein